MAKYKIYAIGYGIDPDTHKPVYGIKCTNWPDCQKYIKNVSDAKYKGFLTDEEADAWLDAKVAEILNNGNPEKCPNPEIKQNDLKEAVKKLYRHITGEFVPESVKIAPYLVLRSNMDAFIHEDDLR